MMIKLPDPGLARRIRLAWGDINVTSTDLRKRFNLSAIAMDSLCKELGPRPSFGTSPKRGGTTQFKLRNRAPALPHRDATDATVGQI